MENRNGMCLLIKVIFTVSNSTYNLAGFSHSQLFVFYSFNCLILNKSYNLTQHAHRMHIQKRAFARSQYFYNFLRMQDSYVGIMYLMLMKASGPPRLSRISRVSWMRSPTFSWNLW